MTLQLSRTLDSPPSRGFLIETLLFNGHIATLDPAKPTATAIEDGHMGS